jgi:hypothetical protein
LTSRRGGALIAGVAVAAVAAASLVGGDRVRADHSFARATCGLGLGPASSPAWSFFGVDPRLSSACEAELFPLPGLACPDPTHGAGVIDLASRP